MRSPQILLISPEAIKEVMVKSFKNFHDNEFSDLVWTSITISQLSTIDGM